MKRDASAEVWWGSQSWLQPAFSRLTLEMSRLNGRRQDCLPHNVRTLKGVYITFGGPQAHGHSVEDAVLFPQSWHAEAPAPRLSRKVGQAFPPANC
jgi:hypothetical protein